MDSDEASSLSFSQSEMKDSSPSTFWRWVVGYLTLGDGFLPESSIFALIIGIDEYADVAIPNLEGAVNDANDVQDFLTSFLHPTSTIISKEDPILIFFAGHGAQAKTPSGWPGNTEQKLQMLVPHDFVSIGSDDIQRGQGVLSVRLSHLLAHLASKKSDNIVRATRKFKPDTEFTARGYDLPESYTIPQGLFNGIPKDILDEYSKLRVGTVAKGFEKSGLRSHILLAACMRDQHARESQRRGMFTSKLIALLKEAGVDKLTYREAITMLPEMTSQNPQCEGFHSDRILFDANVFSQRSGLYPIHATSPGQYEVDAGEAHGVSADAEFTVYSTRDMSFCLGTVIAFKLSPSKTACKPPSGKQPFELCKPGYALHHQVPSIRILIDEGLEKNVEDMKLGGIQIHFVKSHEENPHLAVHLRDGHVLFQVMNQVCRAANFYWHFDHDSGFKAFKEKITIECVQLEGTEKYTDLLDEVLVPVRGCIDLNRNDQIVINMDENEDTKYGFIVTNTTNVPLYASMFYFDMSDLSIVPYYQPATARNGQAELSLPGQSTLTVGYGSTGTTPIRFYLREGQDVDVGFLKIYLSTEYINFSHIIQKSPFNIVPGDSRAMKQDSRPSVWGTKTVRIIQKKEGSIYGLRTQI
ncbi:hypothetical protein BT96DRAFT_995803 [Gymnopus androsaceus JB14]|uniref:Peptidase C14 caspase domain-containing protein n=1 Tax=Gymnopus androsaceus JB14 TaxID=1447944 RepID=A0A6A4HKS3_9AGAR|nr:hypothetical protein BT96DRAFT_995803 [Gymnopus androsaceus JB14]